MLPRYFFITALLAFALAGCSNLTQHDELPADSPITIEPAKKELGSVPFFSQRRRQCGAASLATALAYRGARISAAELEPLLYIPGKEGTLAIDIKAQARQHGFLAYPITGTLEALLTEINAGNPVLIMQNLGLAWLPQWHFAVVIGFDLKEHKLILRSGNEKRHEVSIRTFMNTWRRADYWGVVIMPPFGIPATAEPIPYIKAASELEYNNPEAAREAYQAALEYWPDNPDNIHRLARLGVFNIAYAKKDYREAKSWLLKSKQPLSAAEWNNLAFSLIELHCPDEAITAIHCALQLEPDNPTFQQSKRELEAIHKARSVMTVNSDKTTCGIPSCSDQ